MKADLTRLHQTLLEMWSGHILRRALDQGEATAQMQQRGTSEEKEDVTSPSPLLLQALSTLVRGNQEAGCVYRSEAIWLRWQLLHSFAPSWASRREKEVRDGSDNHPNEVLARQAHQLVLDISILRMLLGPCSMAEELERNSQQLIQDFSLRLTKEQRNRESSSCLRRIRLLVASLAVDESAVQMASLEQQTNGTKTPSGAAHVSFTPIGFTPLPPFASSKHSAANQVEG